MITLHAGGKVVEWAQLPGFFDLRSPVDQVPWNRWRYLKNLRVDDRYGWGVRSGFRRFGHDSRYPNGADLSAATGVINSLYTHSRPNGGSALLAASLTEVFRHHPDGRWTQFGTLPEGKRVVFASVNDIVALANGRKPKYWVAGSTELRDFDELDDIGMSAAGIVASWNGVLFFGDVTMDGTRVGHRLVWSDVNNPTAIAPATGRVSGFQDLDSGATIKAALPLGDAFYVLTDRSIWRVSAVGGDEQYAFQRVYSHPDGEGCLAAPHAYCEVKGSVVYAASDAIYILSPFSVTPERPEWIYRSMRDFDLSECENLSLAYHFPFDEIRISNGVETLCFNWRSQSADVLDHGFTALHSTRIETPETFYEWLLRVPSCSFATLLELWPELADLEDILDPETPPAPPAPGEEEVELTRTEILYPYGETDTRLTGLYYYSFDVGDPDVVLANSAEIKADFTTWLEATYPDYTWSAPSWESTTSEVGGIHILRWLPNGLTTMNPNYVHPDKTSEGQAKYTLESTGTRGVPELIVMDDGAAHEIPCGRETTDPDDGTIFPDTEVDTPVSVTFTIKNHGSATLSGISVTAPAGFTLTDAPASSLAAGVSDTFTLRFDAAVAGRTLGTVTVRSNDSDEDPCTFAISAYASSSPEVAVLGNDTNISDGSASPSEANFTDFGETEIGTSVTREFIIQNLGTARLTLGVVSVPSGFTLLTNAPAYLDPSGEASIHVRLDATTEGTYTGDVSFTCNDEDEAEFNFAITGKVIIAEDDVCDEIPSGPDCETCPGQSVLIGASATDGRLKQDDADIYYRELWNGSAYFESTYSARMLTGCVSFDNRAAKRVQKISFDAIASSGSSLVGYVHRSSLPVDILNPGCTAKRTTLSTKSLACPVAGSEAHPFWSVLLDSRYFTFDFQIPTVTGAVWFSRLGLEIGPAPLTTP